MTYDLELCVFSEEHWRTNFRRFILSMSSPEVRDTPPPKTPVQILD